MSRLLPCLAVAAAVSMVAVPTASYAQSPSGASVNVASLDYTLDTATANKRAAVMDADAKIALYVAQDEPEPPRKKKSNTVLYIVGGVVLVVGLLAIIASNTVALPDDTFDGM